MRKQQRTSRTQTRARQTYWLTPRAWNRSCSHCANPGSIAYRHTPRAYACESCIERLAIKAKPSKTWREGGAKAGSTVTIRQVDPATLRSDGPSPQTRGR